MRNAEESLFGNGSIPFTTFRVPMAGISKRQLGTELTAMTGLRGHKRRNKILRGTCVR